MLVVFIRTLILYLIVVIVMRLMGKRQIGQLQPFELVVAIMISELAAVPMQNTGIPLVNGIIPILTLLIAQILISLVAMHSSKARAIICGRPTILVRNGSVDEQNLRKEMYNVNDLLEQLRIQNMANVSDVEFAILETNGQLSVIPKSQKRPVVPEDLNISTNYEGLPLDIIIDGNVVYKNLRKAKLDYAWLEDQMKSFNITDLNEVLFAILDTKGNLSYQLKSSWRK